MVHAQLLLNTLLKTHEKAYEQTLSVQRAERIQIVCANHTNHACAQCTRRIGAFIVFYSLALHV